MYILPPLFKKRYTLHLILTDSEFDRTIQIHPPRNRPPPPPCTIVNDIRENISTVSPPVPRIERNEI